MQKGIKDNGLVKSIILRKVSSTVLSIVPDNVFITAWEVWAFLANLYDQSNISLQFTIQSQIMSLKMQSATNAEKYVAAHTAANERLACMSVRPPEGDAIYVLLQGLPSSRLWPLVQKTIELEMQQNAQALQTYKATMDVGASLPFNTHIRGTSMALAPPNTSSLQFSVTNPFLALMCSAALVHPYTFQDAASTIISEATQMLQESGLPGPGLEYVNVVQSPRGDNINLETGLCKTKNNPSGTYCTTSGCAP